MFQINIERFINPRPTGRGVEHSPVFLHSCSDNSSTTFLKILGPGHQRSGHQVRPGDPTSEKLHNRVTATVVDRNI